MIVRSSCRVHTENYSSKRQGRRNLATIAIEKIPTGDFTDMELGKSQHSRCRFPVSQIKNVRALFLSVTWACGHVWTLRTGHNQLGSLGRMGGGWKPHHRKNREGSAVGLLRMEKYIVQRTWLLFAKLWRAVMGKSEETCPVGSKRANLEPRDGKEKDKMQ